MCKGRNCGTWHFHLHCLHYAIRIMTTIKKSKLHLLVFVGCQIVLLQIHTVQVKTKNSKVKADDSFQ